MNYKIKAKLNGQFFTYGNLAPSKFADTNKLRLGLRVTPELRRMVAETPEGGWMNFDAFPEDGDRPKPPPPAPPAASPADLDDEIPF